MKKSTLVFLLIFAALFAYVWFVARKEPRGTTAPSPDRARVFDMTAQQIRKIEIDHGDLSVVLARSGPTTWRMEKPVNDFADSFQVENLASMISSLTPVEQVSREENLKAYGLDRRVTTLKVSPVNGAPVQIRVGMESPTKQGYYAFLPYKGEIALLPADFCELLAKPAEAWRDHAVFHFDPSKVMQVEIQARGHDLILSKNGKAWEMKSPVKQKADAAKVQGLLNTMADLHLNNFLQGKAKGSFQHPLITLSVWERGQAEATSLVVGRKTPGGYPAISSDRSFPYLVGNSVIQALTRDPLSYEDLHLLSFSEEAITKLEVMKGKEQIVFEKKGNDWRVTSPPTSKVEGWKAGILVNDVKGLESAAFPGKPPRVKKPIAVVSLWSGKTLAGRISVGPITRIGKQSAYPVEVFPSSKLSWADASLLVKDLP